MQKLVFFGFILILSGNLYAEIPQTVLDYLQEQLQVHLVDHTSIYFSNNQRLIIAENYTNLLMNKFHDDIKLTPTFSRLELLHYIKTHVMARLNSYYKVPSPIRLEKLKNTIEDLFLIASYGDHPLSSEKEQESIYYKPMPFVGKHAYRIQVKYKETVLPLLVTISFSEKSGQIDDDSSIKLELYGLSFRDERDCLRTSFTRASDTLKIDMIVPQYAACPIPIQQQGNFLLEFAEAIGKALKVSKLTLSDSSNILCLENGEDINLSLLKLFQQGKTWYESKGFAVEANKKKRYEEKRNRLLSFKISELESNLTSAEDEVKRSKGKDDGIYIRNFLTMKPVVEQYLQTYKRETNGKLLQGFMAWLYSQSCAQYYNIVRFLFPSSNDLPYKIPVMDWYQAYIPLGQKYYKRLKD